ncbi:FAD-dependent oxidoreductase [Spiractinospora alimapuensis]|uniref:FAD-dependent oxidoreductase n=1 Tax=Spiractinospora alimapuensis TaxID=2820884 RepID=UPI001F1F70BE|nr:FAD-dependent oxidoreductase [Spiractinospora alimapuensis]QVQ51376.1 FAD-dependent oxidoreductase [Spiractinospora alimapuensis]
MSEYRIVVVGAGAAGNAAARTLARAGVDLEVHLVAETDTPPYNRTLVNKGVVAGLIEPDMAALPHPEGATLSHDSAVAIDADRAVVTLESGMVLRFDAAIVATGSAPRRLDPDTPGLAGAVTTGRVHTLHSMTDARRVRDLTRSVSGPARIILLGAGLLAAETSALLRQDGHDVTLVARSVLPGATVFGATIAAELAALHREHAATHFGREPRSFAVDDTSVTITLDDGTRIHGDLAVVSMGTVPTAPELPGSADGVAVDDRLRHLALPAIYAAGGVAVHQGVDGTTYRVDHWDDASAQGTHAALALVHDLGWGDDPGPYRPRSGYVSRVYDATLSGAGHVGVGTTERVVAQSPPLAVHERADGVPTGVVGLNAGSEVRAWASRLHTRG